jgi:hypothetical protein
MRMKPAIYGWADLRVLQHDSAALQRYFNLRCRMDKTVRN